MKFAEENLDILQNLEFAIVEVWRAHPEMTDNVAQRAYEAARQFYRAEQRGNPPKLPALTGLDATAFESLRTGKSVERHTRSGGRQGYLTFIHGFLP